MNRWAEPPRRRLLRHLALILLLSCTHKPTHRSQSEREEKRKNIFSAKSLFFFLFSFLFVFSDRVRCIPTPPRPEIGGGGLGVACPSSIQPGFRHWDPVCGLGAAPDKPKGWDLSNFDEFPACSDAEAVFGGVVCVAVIVAPQGVLFVVHMANDRHRDHSDGCADDERSSYQLFHFTSIPSRLAAGSSVGPP